MGSVTLALVLVAAVLLTFGAHVRSAGYVYEDAPLFEAAAVQPSVNPLRGRWLAALAWHLVPMAPAGHALSVGLHVLVVALVWALVVRLSGSVALAWVTTAIVALHPLQVEPVAYAAARGELIAAVGVVSACLLATTRSVWGWLLVPLCALVGFGGKESAVVLVALLPLTLAMQGRLRWWMGRLIVGYGLAFLCAMFVHYGYGTDPWRIVTIGDAGSAVGAGTWLLLQSTAAYRLLVLSLAPLWLTVDPDLSRVSLVGAWFALVVLGGLCEFAWRQWHARPMLAFGLAWMLIGILPRLLIQTPRSVFNEHQWYLPMVGVSLVLAFAIVPEPRRVPA